ncbi:haloalkane dehalogenase [Nonomuraea roseoviolacea subsp. roseoviolacea]|uniref:haloalkane dehalogenase n=1 Tax=Nonomuraea roseoviolacea TaxID=103837 RepID=UPI0031DE3BAC
MPVIDVLDSTVFYEETGAGAPIVFLHGNPGSSRLWRQVMPAIGVSGRLLAPDLIGMGRSGKPDIAYTFGDHARYLDAWFDALGLDDVILVGHDWGGALAFDWAARHPERVRGIAFFETIVKTLSWSDLGEGPRARARAIRGPEGEALVLDGHFLIDTAYTGGVLNPLPEEEIARFREPYPTRESRRPLLQWARSLPLDGEPAEVAQRVEAYDAWLTKSDDVPKLLLTFDSSPTLLITPDVAAWCAATFAALEVEHVGAAGHHAPEDRPADIAAAVTAWARRHGLAG